MEKKKVRDMLNPYGEKPNYGKIGRRRRLSKLNVFFFFFSIILSVTIYICIHIYMYIYIYIYLDIYIYMYILINIHNLKISLIFIDEYS